MARLLLSLLIGAVITFFLFVLMAFLVDSDDAVSNVAKEQIVIEINSTPPESKAQTRTRVPPPPPPPPPEPPKQQIVQEASNTDAGTIGFNAPTVDVGGVNNGIGDPSGAMMRDGDATPIVRIEPKYPVQAARDGINGWVKMRFSIMPDGSVDEIEVVDAEPKRVFDREAIRALKRWKYSPKIENGQALKQTGIMVQLDFNLDNAGG
ncbi:energy transducer TonB [Rheinheimera sp. F8]|jgi:protein TonB|uniref:energy transducer TonB n=1 Tax=Rheinheimera sp. F8 TaxID=1763998 RepID=UPI000744D44F|nr:energy transducer TonB [Rheinheimera sp. F8]ALZ75020.1 energy transducer TonB [Rheinheimera sp. F8]ALZ76554.1 energy transducer TonB [Rheinheimera sp. F8]